ncbi:MAG: hypothetical protein QM776_12100 [Rhodocyclaceae bacterium]
MKRFIILAGLLSLLQLAACSFPWRIELRNETGSDLVIKTGRSDLDIASGEERVFEYPQDSLNWTLKVVSGRCEYVYQLPRGLPNYPRHLSQPMMPTLAKIDASFVISLLLPKQPQAAPGQSDEEALRKDGFPLAPSNKTCS